MNRLFSFALILLSASTAFPQRGGGSHSGSRPGAMGTAGHRPGGVGSGYRPPSGSSFRPGYRSGFYGSGFGYYPGFYSGFSSPWFSSPWFGSPWLDSYNNYASSGYVSAPAYYESAPPPPPVVINEYYRPPTVQPRFRDYSDGGYGIEPPQQPAAAPAKKPDNWLLAFRNGTIILAVTYWTEHDTLHYVTLKKEQKEIPISAMDRDLTEQLNQERGLEFRIPK